jgi:hypothetical protein
MPIWPATSPVSTTGIGFTVAPFGFAAGVTVRKDDACGRRKVWRTDGSALLSEEDSIYGTGNLHGCQSWC